MTPSVGAGLRPMPLSLLSPMPLTISPLEKIFRKQLHAEALLDGHRVKDKPACYLLMDKIRALRQYPINRQDQDNYRYDGVDCLGVLRQPIR